MGCFDVSCGVSNMTIRSGDEAYLLLLIPNSMELDRNDKLSSNVLLKPTKNYVSNDGTTGLYRPFCLPIKGKYNDYGGLENIKRDWTVKKLEEYFNISIQQILDIIGSNRDIWDSNSGCLAAYGDGLKIGYNKLNKEWLKAAGFFQKEGNDTDWFHPDVENIKKWDGKKWIDTGNPVAYVTWKIQENISPKPKKPDFVLKYWKTTYYEEGWINNIDDFCNDFFFKTYTGVTHGVPIGFKKDNFEKVLMLRQLSGMFISGELYDEFGKEYKTSYKKFYKNQHPNREVLERLGFEKLFIINDKYEKADHIKPVERYGTFYYIYGHKDMKNKVVLCNIDKYNYNSVQILSYKNGEVIKAKNEWNSRILYLNDFIKKAAKAGVKLDISIIENLEPSQLYLDTMKNFFHRMDELRGDYGKDAKYDFLTEMIVNDFKRDKGSFVFRELNNCPIINQLYKDLIMQDNTLLKKDLTKFLGFFSIMKNSNKLLMPSSHFEQHGYFKGQLKLQNMIIKLLKKRIKEEEEYYDSEEE